MSKYINSLMQISAASVAMMSALVADQANMNNTNNPRPECMVAPVCSTYPRLDDGYGVHLEVGYLLEQFVLTGTDFAYTTSEGDYSSIPQSVKVLRPKFNVASGVTAELGLFFGHDNWFLNSKFDWVQRKGHSNWAAESATDFIVPINLRTAGMLGGGTAATYFTSVQESLKTSYYALQLDLNKGFYTSHCLAFEPHAGLKAAWIYYTGAAAFTGGAARVNTLNHNQTTKFWGVGPDFGLNTQWHFSRGFSFFCDSTVAILCGQSNVKDWQFENASTTVATYGRERVLVLSPTARAILGFEYCAPIFDDSQSINFKLAVDSAYYWNQFQHLVVGSATSNYSLVDSSGFGMIGMIAELGWDF